MQNMPDGFTIVREVESSSERSFTNRRGKVVRQRVKMIKVTKSRSASHSSLKSGNSHPHEVKVAPIKVAHKHKNAPLTLMKMAQLAPLKIVIK